MIPPRVCRRRCGDDGGAHWCLDLLGNAPSDTPARSFVCAQVKRTDSGRREDLAQTRRGARSSVLGSWTSWPSTARSTGRTRPGLVNRTRRRGPSFFVVIVRVPVVVRAAVLVLLLGPRRRGGAGGRRGGRGALPRRRRVVPREDRWCERGRHLRCRLRRRRPRGRM